MLWSLCACSTIFCFCLLSFPRHFCCSRLVLFHPAACLFCQCLSSMKEGIGSWACLIFFCFFFFYFVFFLIHAFSAASFVVFLHVFLAMFVISFDLTFLSFMQFFLLTFSVVPCFFSSCFFILVFTHILLYKRIWTFVGQIVFTRSEGIRLNWLYSTKVILLKNCILLQITFLAFLS